MCEVSYLYPFSLCVKAWSVKAMCVDSCCWCWVWTGCRGGQNMCVSRPLQAAWWPNTAQTAHTATALATLANKHNTEFSIIQTTFLKYSTHSHTVTQKHTGYLPAVCVAPRYPHWCCSVVPELESLEDWALQSVNLNHTCTHAHTYICYGHYFSIFKEGS